MNFSIKKLRKKNKIETEKDRKFLLQMASLVGGVLVVFFLSFAIYKIIKSIDFSTIVLSSFSTPLHQDTTGKINILLIGVGGEGHEGPNLTDTLMVAHIDPKEKTMTTLSIPRDFYVTDSKKGGSKINAVYDAALKKYGEEQGMEALIETIEDVTNMDIPYYIKVDFDGFVEIVDSLGGVQVDVKKRIYDREYPLGYGYQVFKLEEGIQTLDGENALKYARSRHGQGNERGDYDRTERQQQLLFALKEKALSLNILENADKLKGLYGGLQHAIETDLSLPEMLSLAQIAKDLKREDIHPLVFHDDLTSCGGLLYAPPKEYYGGFVTLPVGEDNTYLKLFSEMVVPNIDEIQKTARIHVANGTKVTGIALETANALKRFCFPEVTTGNALDQTINTSMIYYNVDEEGNPPPMVNVLEDLLSIPSQEGIPKGYLEEKPDAVKEAETKPNTAAAKVNTAISVDEPSLVIELGKDYLQLRKNDPFRTF